MQSRCSIPPEVHIISPRTDTHIQSAFIQTRVYQNILKAHVFTAIIAQSVYHPKSSIYCDMKW